MKIAIIFASGEGKRLQPLTNNIHKSLIKIHDVPLIEHLINNLLQIKDLNKIFIVTGYRHQDFIYLTKKYANLSLVYNNNYLPYESAYALTLVKDYFTNSNELFIISGDFVMKTNCFIKAIDGNVMAAMKRKDNNKLDWSYQLDNNNNIIDLIKSNQPNALLASEWTHINSKWAKALAIDLNDKTGQKTLKTTIIGKYLINNSIKNHIALKPYLLDYDDFWDLDTFDDLARTKKF